MWLQCATRSYGEDHYMQVGSVLLRRCRIGGFFTPLYGDTGYMVSYSTVWRHCIPLFTPLYGATGHGFLLHCMAPLYTFVYSTEWRHGTCATVITTTLLDMLVIGHSRAVPLPFF